MGKNKNKSHVCVIVCQVKNLSATHNYQGLPLNWALKLEMSWFMSIAELQLMGCLSSQKKQQKVNNWQIQLICIHLRFLVWFCYKITHKKFCSNWIKPFKLEGRCSCIFWRRAVLWLAHLALILRLPIAFQFKPH